MVRASFQAYRLGIEVGAIFQVEDIIKGRPGSHLQGSWRVLRFRLTIVSGEGSICLKLLAFPLFFRN